MSQPYNCIFYLLLFLSSFLPLANARDCILYPNGTVTLEGELVDPESGVVYTEENCTRLEEDMDPSGDICPCGIGFNHLPPASAGQLPASPSLLSLVSVVHINDMNNVYCGGVLITTKGFLTSSNCGFMINSRKQSHLARLRRPPAQPGHAKFVYMAISKVGSANGLSYVKLRTPVEGLTSLDLPCTPMREVEKTGPGLLASWKHNTARQQTLTVYNDASCLTKMPNHFGVGLRCAARQSNHCHGATDGNPLFLQKEVNGARYLQLVGISRYGSLCNKGGGELKAELYVKVDDMAVNSWLYQMKGSFRSC